MASREIKELSKEMQILYNKFFDRCRRDTQLLKEGIAVLLTCTLREGRGKDKINRVPSEAFEVVMLRDGKVVLALDDRIIEHGREAGLRYTGDDQFEKG
jgi:hypothetical protein